MNENQLTFSEKRRDTGSNRLKMIAIFLVLMSHVTQTVTEPNPYLGDQDYLVDLNRATSSIQQFVLIVLRHAGMQGNAIFFFCSAWYLVDRSKVSAKK